MSHDAWTARRTPGPSPARTLVPAESRSGGLLDASFAELVAFFVKASLAAAVALAVTSVVWLALATTAVGVGTGLYLASQRLGPQPVQPTFQRASVAAVIAVPSAPPVAQEAPVALDVPALAAPSPAARPPAVRAKADAERANLATDAAIRAEILRMRARRQ